MQQPLSQSLTEILTESSASDGLTLNRLLERTRGRGLYLVIIVLCLPFVVPLSIPGLSTLMGTIIALLMLRLAFGQAPRLPRFLGERKLPEKVRHRMLDGGLRWLRWLEKLARPRRTQWLSWRLARLVNCLFIVLLALLLALPLPSPPFFFSNSIPSYGIILLAASMMEEDGVLIWFGYLLLILNIIFFSLIGGAVVEVFLKGWLLLSHYISAL